MKVNNMTSPHSGRPVPNQFVIIRNNNNDIGREEIFQSYNSTIVKEVWDKDWNKTVYLDENYWDYSRTTGKYRNQFLGESKYETQKKIDSGEYILTNLN